MSPYCVAVFYPGISLNKLDSTGPKDVPCKISMYLGQWLMRRRFLKCVFIFCPLRGPKKGQSLYLNISESPSPTDASYQLWLKFAHWFLRSAMPSDR